MLCVLMEDSSPNIPGFDFSNLGLVENCVLMSMTLLIHTEH